MNKLTDKQSVIDAYNRFDENNKPDAVYCELQWDDTDDGDTFEDMVALFPTIGEDCDDDVIYSCHGGISEFISLMDKSNKSADFTVVAVLGFSTII